MCCSMVFMNTHVPVVVSACAWEYLDRAGVEGATGVFRTTVLLQRRKEFGQRIEIAMKPPVHRMKAQSVAVGVSWQHSLHALQLVESTTVCSLKSTIRTHAALARPCKSVHAVMSCGRPHPAQQMNDGENLTIPHRGCMLLPVSRARLSRLVFHRR